MKISSNGDRIRMDSRVRPQIIGGIFGLEEAQVVKSCTPPFLKDGDIFLANARSGIFLLVELLSPHTVWMPSYLCDSMLQAVDKGATSVKFYEVNYDLIVPSLDWLDNVQEGDLVILIDYFGFPCDSQCAIRVKEQGAWVLEDACQALLSDDVGRFSDFVLFSPRKFLGVPDGGILTLNCETDFDGIDLESPPTKWLLKTLFATILRREFDIHGGGHRWFKLFREAESECPIGHYTMSELSKTLLMSGFTYSEVAQRRIENYHILTAKLGHLALFPKLSPGVVPLGFPICLQDRDRVRQILFDHAIYSPIHWLIQGIVPERFRDSHRLAADIMTLPCDQRYTSMDMDRMAQVILKELKE